MVKRFLLAVFVISLLNAGVYAEEKPESKKTDNPPETLLNSTALRFSGYGAPVYRFSRAGEKYGHYAGGRGGLIINDSFVIGAGGFGLIDPYKRDEISGIPYSGAEPYVNFGFGGLLLEYYFSPKKLVHFSMGTLIGGGGIRFHDREYRDENRHTRIRFFVVEPEINMFINVAHHFRIGVGASYRYMKGASASELRDEDFRGFSGSLIFAFGAF